MMIQLALGVMNPLVMVGVALVIAAEKLLPRPEIVFRFIGVVAIVAGSERSPGFCLHINNEDDFRLSPLFRTSP